MDKDVVCVCVCVYIYIVCIHIYIVCTQIVCVYTHTMVYYSAIKKNETLPFVTTWMDLEGIMLSEISQKEKDKYCMILLIFGI